MSSADVSERPPKIELLSSRPWMTTDVPAEAVAVPSMLSYRERQLLHWLARDYVTGVGRIVDGGSFLGGSTAAFASGLAARADAPWDEMIVAYDLFRVEEYTLEGWGHCFSEKRAGASFRPSFDANVAAWANYIDVKEGDAVAEGWCGEPIEVLFIDMSKSWRLNDFILEKMMPSLIPGHSIIVQQDYMWGYLPWIHITMELMDSSVKILDSMANGSVPYLLTGPVPRELVGVKLRDWLPDDEKLRLMDRAVARWTGDEQGLVELARVMLMAELRGTATAQVELEKVLARHPDEPRVKQCSPGVRWNISDAARSWVD